MTRNNLLVTAQSSTDTISKKKKQQQQQKNGKKLSNFIKDQIFHKPVAKLRVQFVVFKNFSSALLQETAREIMLLPSDNIHEKGIS